MRLVQVLIPEGASEAVEQALDEEGVDYAVFEERGRGEFEAMVQFPVPPTGVETILERLREAGIDEDAYTIVLPTETVVSTRLAMLSERFSGTRISREELLARAEDAAPVNSTFFAFLLLSTVIAATGLLLDSAATIIGAMVVAPLMGPAISASVGTVLNEREMARRGVMLQVVGLIAAVVTAALMGFLFKETMLLPPELDIRTVPQIAERISPNFLSLFLALGSGMAGAISIIRNAGSTLVGVAIAVALVPPAATSGLGLAWGLPGVAIAALVLVVVNLLAINLTALILFWLAGYRPAGAGSGVGVGRSARRSLLGRIGVIAVALSLLTILLAGVTLVSFDVAAFESNVNQEARELVLADYEGEMTFERVDVEYQLADVLLGLDPQVTVYVGLDSGESLPENFADDMDAHLTERVGRDMITRVGVVEGAIAVDDQEAARARARGDDLAGQGSIFDRLAGLVSRVFSVAGPQATPPQVAHY
jgi:uncharacterized hydrophobic protein (TIGR00341 family)